MERLYNHALCPNGGSGSLSLWAFSPLLLLLLSLLLALPLSFSSGYSPWANGYPHCSGVKFDCSTFLVTYDVPRITIFCSESTELLSSHGFVFFFKTFGTIQVFPVFTRIITHFIFHIRCISIHGLLHFSFFFLLPFS